MANLLLTKRCVRSCPYCFAGREMADSTPEDAVSWENLVYVADFLQSSGENHISLLGGEPTLHPEFVDFVIYLLERGFRLTVFTCGIMSESRFDEIKSHLTKIPLERLTIVCNINHPEQTPSTSEEEKRAHRFLTLMGPWTMPGFNIYRLDFKLDFIFDLVNRYGMRRELRLGIAHPVPGLNNIYIPPEQITEVLNRLYSYRYLFDRSRVKPGLDCGFPLCSFSNEQLGWLYRLKDHNDFGCGPALDITPDMSVYSCFPLSRFQRKSLFDFNSIKEVVEFYRKLHNSIRAEMAGIFEKCDGCVHREEGRCAGGGVCQMLNRFTNEAPVRIPEIERGLAKINLPI